MLTVFLGIIDYITPPPPWDKCIALCFTSGSTSSIGANRINIALNPCQYLNIKVKRGLNKR